MQSWLFNKIYLRYYNASSASTGKIFIFNNLLYFALNLICLFRFVEIDFHSLNKYLLMLIWVRFLQWNCTIGYLFWMNGIFVYCCCNIIIFKSKYVQLFTLVRNEGTMEIFFTEYSLLHPQHTKENKIDSTQWIFKKLIFF